MNEHVKGIKLVHQLLIVTISAVLGFALTPNMEPKFEKADQTLEFLQELSPDSWDQYIATLTDGTSSADNKYLHRILHSIDPSFGSDVRIQMFIYGDMHYPLGGTLSNIEQYVQTEQRVQTVALKQDINTVVQQWKNAIRPVSPTVSTVTSNSSPNPRISTATLSPPEGGWSGNIIHLVPIDSQQINRNAQLMVSLDPTTVPTGVNRNTFVLYIPTVLGPLQKKRLALEWLRSRDIGGKVFDKEHQQKIFTSLEPFIREISGLDVSQARQRLQSKREAQHGKISLFGLSVEADSTVTVMPWITSGILLFFIAHIRQFRLVANQTDLDTSIWVGLFDDWVGKVIAFFTIIVMPIFANYLLSVRHGQPLTQSRGECLSLIIVAILSVWSYAELFRLRSHLAHRSHSFYDIA